MRQQIILLPIALGAESAATLPFHLNFGNTAEVRPRIRGA